MTPKYRMLDLFCGRWGWTKVFDAHGWECVGVDRIHSPESQPPRAAFVQDDVLNITPEWVRRCGFDFGCASSPCEKFSVFAMPNFHPNPPYPEEGIRLFNHTRAVFELAGIPYIMENVRAAQDFVGRAANHCGPFYLWGPGVPPLMPQGIRKNMVMGNSKLVNELKRNGDRAAIKAYRKQFDMMWSSSKSPERKEATAKAATIPPELAATVCDYAERLLEQKQAGMILACHERTGS